MTLEGRENVVPESISSLNDRRAPSRHSSIQGPYREGTKDTSFPVYRTIRTPGRATSQIYARSLLGTGNGLPLNDIVGDESRPDIHIKNGALLGDVGYVDHSGYFSFSFNIFFPPEHPIHKYGVPPKFSPALSGLSSEDYLITPSYHPPGTVITSPGIKMSMVESLGLQFETSALEGSVLILPSGATREELVNPDRFYPYLKEHAASWYQYYNGNSEEYAPQRHAANGTLCIVTGVDRVDSWAMATFPMHSEGIGKPRQFNYLVQNDESHWTVDFGSTLCQTKRLTDGIQGAIFLRVLTIALGSGEWSRNVAYIAPDEVRSYTILSTRMFGLGGRIQRALPSLQIFSKQSTMENEELLFNPSTILLNILILTVPSATVAIVPDSVWSSQLRGRHLTHPEVVTVIRKVILNYEIENNDGVVTFALKENQGQSPTVPNLSWKAVPHSYMRRMIPWKGRSQPKDLRTKALENMDRVLSL